MVSAYAETAVELLKSEFTIAVRKRMNDMDNVVAIIVNAKDPLPPSFVDVSVLRNRRPIASVNRHGKKESNVSIMDKNSLSLSINNRNRWSNLANSARETSTIIRQRKKLPIVDPTSIDFVKAYKIDKNATNKIATIRFAKVKLTGFKTLVAPGLTVLKRLRKNIKTNIKMVRALRDIVQPAYLLFVNMSHGLYANSNDKMITTESSRKPNSAVFDLLLYLKLLE